MPSEEAITELIEDKFVTVKEELEEIIDEVKNDVDEKSIQISNNKRSQDQSFEQIHTAMERLRKDLKQLGDKERRSIDQNNRELKNKLLANIDEVDENLKNVKTTMAGKIEELQSKIIEIEGDNKSKLHELEASYTSKLQHMEASNESKLLEIEANQRSQLLELEAYNLLMLSWAGTNSKRIEGMGDRLLQRIDEKIDQLIQRQDRIFEEMERSRERESQSVEEFKSDAEDLIFKVNEVSEKIMDFEKNKRNNLIIFGIPNDSHETPSSLDVKLQEIFRNMLLIRKDLELTRVSRITVGPEVGNCMPVLMSFKKFKEREEVWKKSQMLQGSGLHISEDVTRRAKDSRTELRRFTRELKLNDPDAVVDMEYDNLKVNGKRYTWSDAINAVIDTQENKVVYEPRCKSRDTSPTKPMSRAASRTGGRKLSRARTPSVKTDRLARAMSQPPTPSPSLLPLLQLGESCEIVDSLLPDSDKMRRIRELEDNVRIQEEVVINLKEKLSNGPENGEDGECW